jgi:O6-methylguanine-DNA--protein-cysteine methyltransferase
MIQKVRRALKDHREGKTVTVGSVAELLGKRSSA